MVKRRYPESQQFSLIACRLENEMKKNLEEKAFSQRLSLSAFLRKLIHKEFKSKTRKVA